VINGPLWVCFFSLIHGQLSHPGGRSPGRLQRPPTSLLPHLRVSCGWRVHGVKKPGSSVAPRAPVTSPARGVSPRATRSACAKQWPRLHHAWVSPTAPRGCVVMQPVAQASGGTACSGPQGAPPLGWMPPPLRSRVASVGPRARGGPSGSGCACGDACTLAHGRWGAWCLGPRGQRRTNGIGTGTWTAAPRSGPGRPLASRVCAGAKGDA
jgi:hypothetical protein